MKNIGKPVPVYVLFSTHQYFVTKVNFTIVKVIRHFEKTNTFVVTENFRMYNLFWIPQIAVYK